MPTETPTATDALAALQDRVRAAAAAGTPLEIRGGGSKAFYGNAVGGGALSTREHAGIVLYEPSELVLTARGGTPLTVVEAALAEHGQMLAFEPPHFGGGASLGGAIATGLSGPRRPWAGAARDFVLGLRLVDGTGQELRFGGRVMKNVAGFDVARLATGSLGTLGVITEVSLKCLPLPKRETTHVQESSAADALARMCAFAREPLPISATCHHAGRLWIRLSGAAPAVEAAARRIGGEAVADADAASLWRSLRDQTHPFFAPVPDGGLWRVSVKATAPLDPVAGDPLIEWGGALRWYRRNGDPEANGAALRRYAAGQGGHATLFRAKGAAKDVFQTPAGALLDLQRRLKQRFDPKGILNPGRLYPGV